MWNRYARLLPRINTSSDVDSYPSTQETAAQAPRVILAVSTERLYCNLCVSVAQEDLPDLQHHCSLKNVC